MTSLKNLSWAKLRGKQAQDEEAANLPASSKADAADKHEGAAQVTLDVGHDTPHEAKPDRPSLVNRLFLTRKAAPKQQPVDIEMGSLDQLSHKF